MLGSALLVAFLGVARAYIPALPVNDTTSLQRSSDVIQITWEPSGVFRTELSRQLIADAASYGNETYIPPSQDTIARGVLVHFGEQQTPQPGTKVPWIAFVTCDTNGTSFSDTDDIFSLARDRGAVAALLYSFTSEGCQINQDYLQNFQKPLDVYATTSKQGSRLIDSQFSNVGTMAYAYNSLTLNQSANSISALLNSSTFVVTNPAGNTTLQISSLTEAAVGTTVANLTLIRSSTTSASGSRSTAFNSTSTNTSSSTVLTSRFSSSTALSSFESSNTPTPTSPLPLSTRIEKRLATPTLVARQASSTIGAAFLLAVMASADSTFGTTSTNTTSTTTPPSSGGNGVPSTGLAMVILYSITGLVSVMFLVVILSGAIRAIRHPERYGPRLPGRRSRRRREGSDAGDSSDEDHDGREGGQSRTRGLTRAILDTFPVVKFGTGTEERVKREDADRRKEYELERIGFGNVIRSVGEEERKREAAEQATIVDETTDSNGPIVTNIVLPDSPPSPSSPAPIVDSTAPPVAPDSTTTCPICVEDFDPDDDIRVLPCDGRHAFHRACIDPWLLEVSSLCPLCRLDLSTSKQSHEPSDAILPSSPLPSSTTGPTSGRRRASRSVSNEEGDEAVVIANLRGMLERGRSSSNAGSPSALRGVGGGGGVGLGGEMGLMRNRFFRYVASKRNTRAGTSTASPPSTSTPTLPSAAPVLPPLPPSTPLSGRNPIPSSTSGLTATTEEEEHSHDVRR